MQSVAHVRYVALPRHYRAAAKRADLQKLGSAPTHGTSHTDRCYKLPSVQSTLELTSFVWNFPVAWIALVQQEQPIINVIEREEGVPPTLRFRY